MKVRYFNIAILNVFLLVTLSVSVYGSVYNTFYGQAAPIRAETPKVVLQSGIAGTSTIYTNNTSAKVSVVAPRNWWNLDYDYRKQISIINNVASTLGSGYSVCLIVNTASLVSGGKMLPSGNDLRIVYLNGSSWVEIDRDVIDMNAGSTKVWFKTQAGISASGSDNNYYMYYGNPSAASPPANKSNVYDFWDDFNDGSLGSAWTFSQIGGASGSCSESGTVVILNATNSGDLWDASDNLLFLSISRSYDVLVESYTSSWGGSHQTWSKMGGVQLRQSLDANSKNRIMSPVYSAVGATNSYRLSTGGSTFEQTTSTQPKYCRLSRIEGTSRAWYSTDGVSWTELGSQISFSGGLSNPVRLGIHLAGLSSSSHWVEVDWFKVRKYVDPEPSTSVGPEESYSYYPTGYNVLAGNYVSGSVPSSVQTVDTNYFNVKSVGTSTAYNPSGYSLLGSTTWVSGATGDLTSNNAAYMTFRSYVSSTSTTTKTDAFIAYRSNTGANTSSSPKIRNWDGDTALWDAENEMSTAGSPVRYVRVAVSPIPQRALEKIVVTLSDDGRLDAYVFDGTSWTVTSNIGEVWTTPPADARRPFDIVYESTSGDALLVYGTTVAGGTNDIAYRVWSFQSGWSLEQYYDDAGHATKITATYVVLASDPNSDRIGMAYIDSTNSHANAVIWDGSAWSNSIEVTGAVAITTEECIAIASESVSGAFMAVAGEGEFIKWARFATSWSTVSIFDINSGATSAMNWLKLASSQNNRIMLTSVDGGSDLCTAVWDTNSMGNRQWETATESIGILTSSTYYTSLRFTAQASKPVTNIMVYVQTVSSSPAYRLGIETSASTYLPSGTYVGGASNYAVATPTATGWLNLTLPSPATLTAGTVYHITVRYDSGTIGASNYIALRRLGANMNNFRPNEKTVDSWLNTIYYTTSATVQNRDPLFVLRYSDSTYEAMPYDTATAHNIYGVYWFSEKWTQSGNQVIKGINIPLIKTGTPPDSLYVVLRNETDSQDVATITVPQGDITTPLQWYERYFGSPVQLVNGKTYRLILKSPSSTSLNYFTCRSLSTGQSGALTYDGTNSVYSASINSGSIWTDTTARDLTYIILLQNSGTSGWIPNAPWDATVDTNAQRCADFAWGYRLPPAFENQGLLVYGTTANQITWRRFRAPNYMTAATNVPMGANIHPWVQLKPNTRDITGDMKILGAVLEGTVFAIGAISWDGTTLTVIGTSTITANTNAITYECFEIEYNWFGDPTEFTSEVEFTGTSNTQSWTQLAWTIDSSFTTTGVATTFQLYNYNTSSYPTSGDGYMTDTIGINDITKTQTVTTDPAQFRDAAGNWRIKIKGVKTTTSHFDFGADWIEFKPTYTYGAYTASTEFLFSSMTKNTPTQLNLTIVSEYNIANVSVTIQVWNYSSSTYAVSGEGYLTYTSSGSNETKLLSINTNPQFYTSSGYAKIKVTGVKSTTTQFQQKTNQIKLDYRYSASNYALDYDGSNDYVEVPDSASLDITGEITVEAWIKPIAFTHEFPGIVCKWDWSSINPQRSYSLYLTGYNKVWFMLSNDSLWHDEYSLQSSAVLSTDTWYYIAGVYNGSVMKLYINGVKDAEKNAILTIYSGTAKLSIGSSMTDGSVATDETFNGIIDEVRISNVSRSASEISANWNDGKGKRLEADANTAALWHFDEGTGDTTYDETINDNNGTLKPSYPSDCPSWVNGFSFPTQTYDHVLKVVNRFADNWTVNLQVYDSTNIDRLSSLNISLHDGTSSNQIAISGGTIIKSEGEQYNLPGGSGSTIYISINNLQATTTDTSYLYVYLKIKVPNTSTYNLFIIVFEIT